MKRAFSDCQKCKQRKREGFTDRERERERGADPREGWGEREERDMRRGDEIQHHCH